MCPLMRVSTKNKTVSLAKCLCFRTQAEVPADAATIRRWAGEDAKKAASPTRNRDYSVKEDETV